MSSLNRDSKFPVEFDTGCSLFADYQSFADAVRTHLQICPSSRRCLEIFLLFEHNVALRSLLNDLSAAPILRVERHLNFKTCHNCDGPHLVFCLAFFPLSAGPSIFCTVLQPVPVHWFDHAPFLLFFFDTEPTRSLGHGMCYVHPHSSSSPIYVLED